jgi:hypothetical protein
VDVNVVVDDVSIPQWIVYEFSGLLGKERSANEADQSALVDLSLFPDHIVRQAFGAARVWLNEGRKRPIHSLGRWLVGTAQRKLQAEQIRGSTVSELSIGVQYDLYEGMGGEAAPVEAQAEPTLPEPEATTPEQQIWQDVLRELEMNLPSAIFDSWLRGTYVLSATQEEFVIALTNAFGKDWLENRLSHTIQRTIASLIRHPVVIRFQVV